MMSRPGRTRRLIRADGDLDHARGPADVLQECLMVALVDVDRLDASALGSIQEKLTGPGSRVLVPPALGNLLQPPHRQRGVLPRQFLRGPVLRMRGQSASASRLA